MIWNVAEKGWYSKIIWWNYYRGNCLTDADSSKIKLKAHVRKINNQRKRRIYTKLHNIRISARKIRAATIQAHVMETWGFRQPFVVHHLSVRWFLVEIRVDGQHEEDCFRRCSAAPSARLCSQSEQKARRLFWRSRFAVRVSTRFCRYWTASSCWSWWTECRGTRKCCCYCGCDYRCPDSFPTLFPRLGSRRCSSSQPRCK